nr:hypothetical protein [Haliscomenobacter sp.]
MRRRKEFVKPSVKRRVKC